MRPIAPMNDIPEYLRGVVTLRHLVLALPTVPVTDVMERDIVTVAPGDHADAAARQLVEYGLYAVPVVTDGGVILGTITADDAFDCLLPDSWRKRLRVFS